MDRERIAGISQSMIRAGLAGAREPALVNEFCDRVVASGLPLARASVIIDTLHPVHEGRAFRWLRDEAPTEPVVEYGRTNRGGEVAESWQRSPFYHLAQTGGTILLRNLAPGEPLDFPLLEELRDLGQTGYLALIHRFASEGTIGEMDCIYSSWVTDAPGGFTADHVEALGELIPPFALALKSASLSRILETLVETYLGRDAGHRVLEGRIERGVTDRIGAALWYSDLRGFTPITESAPEQIIPLLNDYADAIISSVHEAGGDVLKLIGDGTLAIFKAGGPGQACRCALKAERLMRSRVSDLNRRRAAEELPTTDVYLALHIGEVFYGNIGSHDRLDFTVVGPAVNEASRIAALCRSIEKDVLISSSFAAAACPEERSSMVSVGRYALKGVERPQELFTLDSDQ